MVFHIARFDYGRIGTRLASPAMGDFVKNTHHINVLGDRAPGFVWQLQIEKRDPKVFRCESGAIPISLSLWESIEQLQSFLASDEYSEVMQPCHEGFEYVEEPCVVLWWVPADQIPSVETSFQRLEHLRKYGPTPFAFTLRHRFPQPDHLKYKVTSRTQASKDAATLGDMDSEEFRTYGFRLVDWTADYLSQPERYQVVPSCKPGEVRGRLSQSPPEKGDSMDAILDDFQELILPGITHWNHPDFFAYFGISASGPGILGELISGALNVNAMLWRTSPAATELEELALSWLRQLLDLDPGFRGTIVDTASMASLLAIAAARENLGLDIRLKGLAGRPLLPRLRLYTSEQAHSSIEKASITLGIGQEGVRKIITAEQFEMDVDALEQAISEDIAASWLPFCVVATVGTTSTTSVDPVSSIAEVSRRHGLWLHVDGAYGGMAAVVPEMRYVLAGCEHADSIVVNPHKWLFTPIDCSALFVRNPDHLKRAFSLVPDYLATRETNVTNYMDWGVQLGRRFRALKLWMVMRYFGHEGLAARIREHIRLGARVASWIDGDSGFERLAPTPFSTICFRAIPREISEERRAASPEQRRQIECYLNRLNEEVVETVNATGRMFVSHTVLNGRYAIRMAIGNIRSMETNVLSAWKLIQRTAIRLHDKRKQGFRHDLRRHG